METSSLHLRKERDRLRALSPWEQEALLQQYTAELMGVKQEMQKWEKQQSALFSKIRKLKNVMEPKFYPGGKGDFVWYKLDHLVLKRGYPKQESPNVKWSISNQYGLVTHDYWFTFGASREICDDLLRRKELKVTTARGPCLVKTNDVYTMTRLLRENGVRLIGLRGKFPATRKKRCHLTNFIFCRIVRTRSGDPVPDLLKEAYGKRLYIHRRYRPKGPAKVHTDRGPIQTDERGGVSSGIGRDILLGTGGDVCCLEKERAITGVRSEPTGGTEQIKKTKETEKGQTDPAGFGGSSCR